ncbi:MAG: hypothetical protein EHM55_01840 [Acidobacteria bacterium]|nr:MAG: hypothetical protein EHM55_01840 [Acidobacteriota bacterium]
MRTEQAALKELVLPSNLPFFCIANPRRLQRDEALAELTTRYFRSHGPATIRDLRGADRCDDAKGAESGGNAFVDGTRAAIWAFPQGQRRPRDARRPGKALTNFDITHSEFVPRC